MIKSSKELPFTVGDYVTCSDSIKAPGGVIYQITEINDPVEAEFEYRAVGKTSYGYEYKKAGYWAPNGKKVSPSKALGYVRARVVFDFFATRKGKSPRGEKMGGMLVTYKDIDTLKKIDIVDLGVKYVELGNLIQNAAKQNNE